jgi:predicted alpha/beta superfamily hydrolase
MEAFVLNNPSNNLVLLQNNSIRQKHKTENLLPGLSGMMLHIFFMLFRFRRPIPIVMLLPIIVLLSALSYGQERTTIRVSVPNKTDEVFIVGNQDVLGTWQPDKIKLDSISEYEREISLALSLPAEFKFTRGSWDTEGYTALFWEPNENIRIIQNTSNQYRYSILSWKDSKPKTGNFSFDFTIQNHFSNIFNEDRTLAIKLPKNYDQNLKYPVLYVLDANTLFKPFVLSTEMLSEKIIIEGLDYGRDNIPELIIVGVFHNNRGMETTPKLDDETDDNLLLEGTDKLRKYLVYELVPFINKSYSTSPYHGIVGHSNTGHFVLNMPFFEDNPFTGIVSLSVNSESEFFKNKVSGYVKSAEENIFIGYGTLDGGFNELGEFLSNEIKSGTIKNPGLKVESFEASHNQLPNLAATSAIKFLFNKYKNHTDFIKASAKPDFTVANYFGMYEANNKKYGVDLKISQDDLFTIAEMAVRQKEINLFREIINFSNQQDDRIVNHLAFWLSTEIGDYETADKIIPYLLTTQDKEDIFLTYANFTQYSTYLIGKKKTPNTALMLVRNMFENTNDYKLEFAYHFAKIAYESNLELKEAKKYLKYCRDNFKENRVFTKADLDKLGTKK